MDVIAVNLSDGRVLLSDGQTVPIDQMMDDEGDDTDDPHAAVCVIAGPDRAGQWWSIALSEYEEVTLH